jgi:hypothetical protein
LFSDSGQTVRPGGRVSQKRACNSAAGHPAGKGIRGESRGQHKRFQASAQSILQLNVAINKTKKGLVQVLEKTFQSQIV